MPATGYDDDFGGADINQRDVNYQRDHDHRADHDVGRPHVLNEHEHDRTGEQQHLDDVLHRAAQLVIHVKLDHDDDNILRAADKLNAAIHDYYKHRARFNEHDDPRDEQHINYDERARKLLDPAEYDVYRACYDLVQHVNAANDYGVYHDVFDIFVDAVKRTYGQLRLVHVNLDDRRSDDVLARIRQHDPDFDDKLAAADNEFAVWKLRADYIDALARVNIFDNLPATPRSLRADDAARNLVAALDDPPAEPAGDRD